MRVRIPPIGSAAAATDRLLVSGEVPTTPVASSKSGAVFEKRLIEAYIAEHAKDPVTGEELSTADLVELKCTRPLLRRRPSRPC